MSTIVKAFRSTLTQLQSSAEQVGRSISKTQLASALSTLEGKKLTAAERTQVQNALKRASLSEAARVIADAFFDTKARSRRNDGDSFKDRVVKVRADLPEDKPGRPGKPPVIVKVKADEPGGPVNKRRADEPVKVMADIPHKIRADEPGTPGKPPVIVKVMADIPHKVRADEPGNPGKPPVIVKVMADIPHKVRADEPQGPVNKIRADEPVKVRADLPEDKPGRPGKPPVIVKVKADEPTI